MRQRKTFLVDLNAYSSFRRQRKTFNYIASPFFSLIRIYTNPGKLAQSAEVKELIGKLSLSQSVHLHHQSLQESILSPLDSPPSDQPRRARTAAVAVDVDLLAAGVALVPVGLAVVAADGLELGLAGALVQHAEVEVGLVARAGAAAGAALGKEIRNRGRCWFSRFELRISKLWS